MLQVSSFGAEVITENVAETSAANGKKVVGQTVDELPAHVSIFGFVLNHLQAYACGFAGSPATAKREFQLRAPKKMFSPIPGRAAISSRIPALHSVHARLHAHPLPDEFILLDGPRLLLLEFHRLRWRICLRWRSNGESRVKINNFHNSCSYWSTPKLEFQSIPRALQWRGKSRGIHDVNFRIIFDTASPKSQIGDPTYCTFLESSRHDLRFEGAHWLRSCFRLTGSWGLWKVQTLRGRRPFWLLGDVHVFFVMFHLLIHHGATNTKIQVSLLLILFCPIPGVLFQDEFFTVSLQGKKGLRRQPTTLRVRHVRHGLDEQQVCRHRFLAQRRSHVLDSVHDALSHTRKLPLQENCEFKKWMMKERRNENTQNSKYNKEEEGSIENSKSRPNGLFAGGPLELACQLYPLPT